MWFILIISSVALRVVILSVRCLLFQLLNVSPNYNIVSPKRNQIFFLEVNTARFLVGELICTESRSFSYRSNSSGNNMLTRLCVSGSVCERVDPSQQHVERRPPGLLIFAKPLLIPSVGEQTYAVCTFRPDQSTAAFPACIPNDIPPVFDVDSWEATHCRRPLDPLLMISTQAWALLLSCLA